MRLRQKEWTLAVNSWGRASRRNRQSIDHQLNTVSDAVLKIKDHSIIKGHRPEAEQHKAFLDGNSKLDWPDGKHNKIPSSAADVKAYPFPPLDPETVDQAQREEQLYLLGLYKGVATVMGIELRTGADWDRDGQIFDNGFDDFFHVEIVQPRN